MEITFSPELPSGEAWEEVRVNVEHELLYWQHQYTGFPQELVVKADVTPFTLRGVACGLDGVVQIRINYEFSAPHTAKYEYVGGGQKITHE